MLKGIEKKCVLTSKVCGSDCGWFHEREKQCSIVSIADNTYWLQQEITKIAEGRGE